MKFNPWTKEERDIALNLSDENKLSKEIASELYRRGYKRTPSAVRHFLNRNEIHGVTRVIPPPQYDPRDVAFNPVDAWGIPEKVTNETISVTIEEDTNLDTLLKIEEKREKTLQANFDMYGHIGNPEGKLYKIVSVSDLHIPFMNAPVINHLIKNHGDADLLVINGDILDQYSVSRWPKTKSVLLEYEYKAAVNLIKQLSLLFKRIVLTRGNHDDRIAKYFSANIDPAISFLTHPDPLERIAKGYDFGKDGDFEKLNKFTNVHYSGGLCAWWCKVGRTIFAHPSGGSGVPMRTAVNVANYFLEKEDFDAIVCAHTHKQGQIIYKGKLVIEQGCACVPMDYEASAKMQYDQQHFGYAVIYMNSKGEVDFDKSRPVYFGTGTCVDADVRLNIKEE